MKRKILGALLIVGILFLTQSPIVHAQMLSAASRGIIGGEIITPQWANVNDITLDLYFDNGDACCSGQIRALSGTTRISANFRLERMISSGWVLENAWSKSSSSNSLLFYGTDAVASGYTYRLSVTADVTRNGVTETVSSSVTGLY